jgi:general stress protein YciG
MGAPSVRNPQRLAIFHHQPVVSVTWFKVDDKLHSHSKTRKVLAEAPAALALWVVAGSWSSDNLTDGFVPDHQLPWLIPVGAEDMARQLVTARLWKRAKGGYQFHQWAADGDGTKRNPTRVEVEAERQKKAEAGRKGGLASGKTRSRNEAPASAPASRLVEPPTRPDPTLLGGALRDPVTPPGAREALPSKCPEHEHLDEPPPCGRCADLRRARTRWEMAEGERVRSAPKCRRHRGQLAENCGLCRSEELAEEN